MDDLRAWVDGALVACDAAAISPLDHGLTVGDGAFETAKVLEGTPFAMTRHLRRLDRTMAGLGLPAPEHDRILAGVAAVLGAGGTIAFGRLRWTVTGGIGPPGSDRGTAPLTYVVTASEAPRRADSLAVSTVPWTRNEHSATAGLKTTSYAENVVALARAKAHGAAEAVFANTRGELCEGTGSNVFVVVDGVVHTPPLDSGCLAGVTRELVVTWCREEGIEVREVPLPLDILRTCAEVFVTSSTRDVMPVHDVDGRAVAVDGPVTTRVAEVFARRASQAPDP